MNMRNIKKIEALIPMLDKATDDVLAVLNLFERLGRIELTNMSTDDLKKYNAVAKLVNLLRLSASAICKKAKQNISVKQADLVRE